jgi:hypothetical protein
MLCRKTTTLGYHNEIQNLAYCFQSSGYPMDTLPLLFKYSKTINSYRLHRSFLMSSL